jgi:Domain of unknown function (DUF4258)
MNAPQVYDMSRGEYNNFCGLPLNAHDIMNVLLNGDLDSTYSDDPRGTRYVIRGDVDEDEVDVVCRFRHDGILLIIITVYVVD